MNRFKSAFSKAAWPLVAILSLGVAACGDGNGNLGTPDSSSNPNGDAPTVKSTGPTSNAAGVATNSKLVATFSIPMDAVSIDSTSFRAAADGESPVTGLVTLDAATNTAVLIPTSGFGASTEYTATITTAVKSMDGMALASDYTWTFTTGASADSAAPTVASTDPATAATDVPLNRSVVVNFSETMDSTTVGATTFMLTGPNGDEIPGNISYLGTTATFDPADLLEANAEYTVTIGTGVSDLAGNELADAVTSTFTTSASLAEGPAPVILGTAGNYVILAKSAISTTGTTDIVGNIAVSPAAETFITGFSQARDASDEFSTSAIVTGNIYAADMAPPTPSVLTTAIGDMEIAYTDAAGRSSPDHTELGAGDISGMTLEPGLYKWGTGLLMASDVTLSGGSNDVWIFQVAEDITVENGVALILAGGAMPKNIFWQVAGQVTLGTTADFKGIILSKTQIVVNNGATLNGRALAQTAVTLDANAVTQPTM